ncbi:MAG: flagellin, partial [Anaerolinea sp.]|nr:flagellin [Anaerolinea sp.]
MSIINRFHKDQSGQTALEAAIILIAFIVVASLFAFAILSAGTSSTEEAEQAIY